MRREIEAELLDDLPSTDSRAVRSRADLRLLNRIMGHPRILTNVLRRCLGRRPVQTRPFEWIELGAGDGTLLLDLARRWSAWGVTARVTLVDQQNIVAENTRRSFQTLGWPLECVTADAFNWLEKGTTTSDVVFANLFLHHFPEASITRLMRSAAKQTNLFIACDPRRNLANLMAARCLPLLACHAVTRHDAVVSVRAGFTGRELSPLWPADDSWILTERAAGCFSHSFVAQHRA
jgi:hypothetical protein